MLYENEGAKEYQYMNLDHLNPEQRKAATHVDGPLLILAGAGSGKTATMTHRIAYLIEQGVSPYQILAVSPPESFLAGARASSVSFRAASNSSARFIPTVLGLSTPRLSVRFCRTLI